MPIVAAGACLELAWELLGVPSRQRRGARMTAAAEAALTAGGYKDAAT